MHALAVHEVLSAITSLMLREVLKFTTIKMTKQTL